VAPLDRREALEVVPQAILPVHGVLRPLAVLIRATLAHHFVVAQGGKDRDALPGGGRRAEFAPVRFHGSLVGDVAADGDEVGSLFGDRLDEGVANLGIGWLLILRARGGRESHITVGHEMELWAEVVQGEGGGRGASDVDRTEPEEEVKEGGGFHANKINN